MDFEKTLSEEEQQKNERKNEAWRMLAHTLDTLGQLSIDDHQSFSEVIRGIDQNMSPAAFSAMKELVKEFTSSRESKG